jgi:ParB family transcriptional regulator, chromosome partitioning protein
MSETREVRQVLLAAITVSAMNSRKNLEAGTEDAGLKELAESIEANGLIQPPTLRELPDGSYEVIAGQRRVLACQLLGWTHIDALISDSDDTGALGLSLVENLQRADMAPLDKAKGLAELVKQTGSELQAARSTGLSMGTVRKYLRLLVLPEDLRLHLGTGEGPSGVGAMSALAQFSADPDDQRAAFERLKGFKGGDAENILRQSRGDFGKLNQLREQVLDGTFNVERCGSNLLNCPWLGELPEQTQQRVMQALDD